MNRIIYLLIVLFFHITLYAQDNSPYSAFQLGDPSNHTNIALQGMGSVSTAISSEKNNINTKNPASYSSIQFTLLNIGLTSQWNNLIDQNGNTNNFNNTNIAGLQLAFPAIRNILGITLGFEPRTKTKYNLQSQENLYNSKGFLIDSVLQKYIGNGGTYYAYAGIGVRYKYVSIGANLGYYWGQKTTSVQREFYDPTIISSNTSIIANIGGFYAELGSLFDIPISKKHGLHIGFTTQIPQKIKTNLDSTYNTYYNTSDYGNIAVDTALYSRTRTYTNLPFTYSVGITYDNIYGITLSADFTSTQWSTFSIPNPGLSPGLSLNNKNWLLKVGGEFIPFNYGTSYIDFIAYRIGFNVGNSPLSYNNKPIQQFEISFGLGLPIKRFAYNNTSSTINVSFTAGKIGNASAPIQSTYYKLGISLSLGDLWFIKRKYD